MRATAILVAALLLAACSDDEPDAACTKWEAIRQDTAISDADAVARLNEIADEAENPYVRNRALDLAILLEGNATQTEVHRAFDDMSAACA